MFWHTRYKWWVRDILFERFVSFGK
jgi:hypothetical protein